MAKRRKASESEVAAFLRKYARKAQKRREPNDRRLDHKVEQMVKRMRPEDLDRLIRGSEGQDTR
ncbi:MAG TPA: hypothetical protein VIF11_22635 [Methylomirabilota bacterium]|jgi:hypothetical protein